MDPCRPYLQMARNAALANARLARVCHELGDAGWHAPGVSFFPSIMATLNHILTVDSFYVDAVEGGTLGPAAWADPVPCPAVADWVAEQVAMDARVVAICLALAPVDLARPVRLHREDRVQVERLDDTLMHLFLHDQHHRGQVHAMLSGTTVPPPQLDEFILADDAALRARDLADMGWTEADLRP